MSIFFTLFMHDFKTHKSQIFEKMLNEKCE